MKFLEVTEYDGDTLLLHCEKILYVMKASEGHAIAVMEDKRQFHLKEEYHLFSRLLLNR